MLQGSDVIASINRERAWGGIVAELERRSPMSPEGIRQLKRDARRLSRSGAMSHHEALDRAAKQRGFATWSLLIAKTSLSAAGEMLGRIAPGDLVLLAARPGEGKTLVSLALAAEAVRCGTSAAFFTLEDTEATVFDRLRGMGERHLRSNGLFRVDASDAICADHVVNASPGAERGSVIVIDTLQRLDQSREKPIVAAQLAVMKRFARDREAIVIILSQVDRSYDPGLKRVPDLRDVRCPNPIDLTMFAKSFFLGAGGSMRVTSS